MPRRDVQWSRGVKATRPAACTGALYPVTVNVGGDPRRSTVFRRSAHGPPIRQSPFGDMRNTLCPIGVSGINTSR